MPKSTYEDRLSKRNVKSIAEPGCKASTHRINEKYFIEEVQPAAWAGITLQCNIDITRFTGRTDLACYVNDVIFLEICSTARQELSQKENLCWTLDFVLRGHSQRREKT